jgi:D-alanyl-D-alanine carboxypeptidase
VTIPPADPASRPTPEGPTPPAQEWHGTPTPEFALPPTLDGRSPPTVARPLPGRSTRSVGLALLIALATLQLAGGLGPTPGSAARSEPAGTSPPSTASGFNPSSSPVSPRASSPVSGVSASPLPSPTSQARSPGEVRSLVLGLLDDHLAELRAQYGIPGISATVLFKDGTRWTGVAGEADLAHGVPVRPGTPFAIASISKTFLSALILSLVEERRLTLDEPAAPHLAAIPGIAIDKRITIAHLLDHTSGLRDFLLDPRIEPAFAANLDARWTAAEAFAFAGKPVAPPGSTFLYSNTNYLLLGLIAEQVTGKTVAVNLRSRFFDPLGLRSASYQGAETPVLPLARPYRFTTGSPTEPPVEIASGTDIVPFSAVVTAAGGAGSVAAASPDVARWARALYTGEVLAMATVTRMVDDAARTTATDPALPYGLGVHVVRIDGHPSLGHSGRYLGARSAVRFFPLEGLTIAVLTNQSRTDPGDILVDLLRIALLG